MEPLHHEFQVPVPIDEAWVVLTDIEGIAPCLPGAQLTEIEGDEYRGKVKVKVGPITAQYKGAATIASMDEANRTLSIDAKGRDTRGQGNAEAVISISMTEAGDATDVVVDTDLKITGKVAQFGRGMIGEVSNKLLDQFVDNLEAKLEEDQSGGEAEAEAEQAPAAEAEGAPTTTAADEKPQVRKIESKEVEAVDLGELAGASVAKRAVPVILVLLILFLLGRRRRSS